MVTAEENLRDRRIAKDGGPCVLGVFEETVREGFFFGTSHVPQNTRDMSYDGVKHRKRRNFAPSENKISEANLSVD